MEGIPTYYPDSEAPEGPAGDFRGREQYGLRMNAEKSRMEWYPPQHDIYQPSGFHNDFPPFPPADAAFGDIENVDPEYSGNVVYDEFGNLRRS